MLSKKWSQEKSYEVRGQSDMCHTSVMFMPAFPWHQMGGKFSHRLVSTLSYILYTCLCQEFSKWFIFFLNFPVCMCYLQLCVPMHVNNFNKSHELQFVQVCWNSNIMLNFECPCWEIHCSSLPPHRREVQLVSQWTASSLDEWPPLSLNKWSPQQMASPSLNEWPPASLDGCPPFSVNGLLPLLMDGLPPWRMASSLPRQTAFSLLMDSLLPPLMNGLLPPSTNSLVLLLADGLPSLNEQLSPSLN